MTRPVDPLVVGRVIGDVLDLFVPAADLIVHYGTKQVGNGCNIKPALAADKPLLQISSTPDGPSFYTVIMVDPDAPSPSEPTFREWLHWMVVNIPEGGDAATGNEVVSYAGPTPPTGIHRYVFTTFRQRGVMQHVKALPNRRNNFCTRFFAMQNQLGLPIAALYFNSQKQPAKKKRF